LALCAKVTSAQEEPRWLGVQAGDESLTLVEPEERQFAAEPKTYGTASESVLVIAGNDVNPPTNTVTYNTRVSGSTGIGIFQTYVCSACPTWWKGVQVPSGAVITRITVDACDTSATGGLVFGMAAGAAPAGAQAFVTPPGYTGNAPTPGCAFFSVTPLATLNVANGMSQYWAFVAWLGDFSGAVRLQGIRVYYMLQVSAAPATATFPTDVPTSHPFFQYIEALAASGITAGCGAGTYCPDQPLTRGQMAVFLSKALGLHFPN